MTDHPVRLPSEPADVQAALEAGETALIFHCGGHIVGCDCFDCRTLRTLTEARAALRVPAQEAPRTQPFDMMQSLKTALNYCDKCGRSDMVAGAAPRAVEGAAELYLGPRSELAGALAEALHAARTKPGGHEVTYAIEGALDALGTARAALSRREPQ